MLTGEKVRVSGDEYDVYISTLNGVKYIYRFNSPSDRDTGKVPVALDRLDWVPVEQTIEETL